jgi:hypothetical protein
MSLLAVLVLYAVFLVIGIAGARKTSAGGWRELLVAGRAGGAGPVAPASGFRLQASGLAVPTGSALALPVAFHST